MIRRPPRSTLFPYTTLFRSARADGLVKDFIRHRVRMIANAGVIEMSRGNTVGARQCFMRVLKYDHAGVGDRSEEHTSELQSHLNLVCRLLLEKTKQRNTYHN